MLALTQAMIHAWTLKPSDYLNFAEQELLDLLIDAGFIFAYEAVACQLRLHGRAPTARQDSVARNISQSALTLLTEILANNPGAQTQSQTRIFGLLSTLTNSRTDLPADLARDIPFSREAIDCITTAAFSYRAHHTLAELSKVLDRSDIHTPTLRSVLHAVKGFKSPLQHRFEQISGSAPAVICIDERMEEALKDAATRPQIRQRNLWRASHPCWNFTGGAISSARSSRAMLMNRIWIWMRASAATPTRTAAQFSSGRQHYRKH
jgi:hypothetical protein